MRKNIERMVNDALSQVMLYHSMRKRAVIAVYTARQNFLAVGQGIINHLNTTYKAQIEDIYQMQDFVRNHFKCELTIYQKPDSYPDGNSLLLTVGGITAIIFDYEESIYD